MQIIIINSCKGRQTYTNKFLCEGNVWTLQFQNNPKTKQQLRNNAPLMLNIINYSHKRLIQQGMFFSICYARVIWAAMLVLPI